METYPPFDCTKCLSRHSFTLWNHVETGVEIGLYTWTHLGACDFNLTPERVLATDDNPRTDPNRWSFSKGKYALDHAFHSHRKITEADSEIDHESFARARHNLAVRNQRLHMLKLCSEGQSTFPETVALNTYQDNHTEQDFSKNKSRVFKFLGQSLRALRHSLGRR